MRLYALSNAAYRVSLYVAQKELKGGGLQTPHGPGAVGAEQRPGAGWITAENFSLIFKKMTDCYGDAFLVVSFSETFVSNVRPSSDNCVVSSSKNVQHSHLSKDVQNYAIFNTRNWHLIYLCIISSQSILIIPTDEFSIN